LCLQKWEFPDEGLERQEVVFMMSEYHDTSMDKMVTSQEEGQQKEIQKPMCVLDYTKQMGDVDCSNHCCATYACN
jgi:hypothetical protein